MTLANYAFLWEFVPLFSVYLEVSGKLFKADGLPQRLYPDTVIRHM